MALVYTPETTCATVTPSSLDDFLNVLAGLSLGVPSLVIDCDRRRVQRNEATLDLTRQEFALLAYLATRADEAVSREELVAHVWANRDLGKDSRTVDITIRRLRVKLNDDELISTVRGQGYRFNSAPHVAVRAVAYQLSCHTLAA